MAKKTKQVRAGFQSVVIPKAGTTKETGDDVSKTTDLLGLAKALVLNLNASGLLASFRMFLIHFDRNENVATCVTNYVSKGQTKNIATNYKAIASQLRLAVNGNAVFCKQYLADNGKVKDTVITTLETKYNADLDKMVMDLDCLAILESGVVK